MPGGTELLFEAGTEKILQQHPEYCEPYFLLKDYYLQFFLNIAEMLKSESIYAQGDLIENVQVYIRHNYQKYLTQEFVASLFYLNRSYLSTLFRKKTGMKFVDYLNEVRIEKAKELLCSSDRKMYQISKAVGYDNPKYFFRIFKKKTGCSPEQYRNEHFREPAKKEEEEVG